MRHNEERSDVVICIIFNKILKKVQDDKICQK